jgi:hypothetical protein
MNKIPKKYIEIILETINSTSLDTSSLWNLYAQIIGILKSLAKKED